jgi:hypothetical protein
VPTLKRCLTRNFPSSISRQRFCTSAPTNPPPFPAISNGGRVFPLFLWRWLAVLDLAARYIDNELGLAKVAGTLGVGALEVACHALIMPQRENLCTVGLEMGHGRIMLNIGHSSHIPSRFIKLTHYQIIGCLWAAATFASNTELSRAATGKAAQSVKVPGAQS